MTDVRTIGRTELLELMQIPPSERCWCGWHRLGECSTCPEGRTNADRIAYGPARSLEEALALLVKAFDRNDVVEIERLATSLRGWCDRNGRTYQKHPPIGGMLEAAAAFAERAARSRILLARDLRDPFVHPCPLCDAAAGETCTNPLGFVTTSHLERFVDEETER